MKSLYIFFVLLMCHSAFAQDTTWLWSWESGSELQNQQPVYGTKGVADATTYPGTRISAATWSTPDGKLWLFGGATRNQDEEPYTNLNDLWMYDPQSKMWTWKQGPRFGDPETSSYGTKGIAHPDNLPPARTAASSWVDNSGNLWMFGGSNNRSLFMNDMWKYDPSTNQWTWMNGTSVAGFDDGGKGTVGVPDPLSFPPAVISTATTSDPAGNFWMVGGYRQVIFREDVYFTTREVWKFDPVSALWTYYSTRDDFYDAIFTQPNFGTKGVSSPDNLPPTRAAAALWADSTGHLYWYGGYEYYFTGTGSDDIAFNSAPRNDVWQYDTLTRVWTWIAGSSERAVPARYGTKGMTDPLNTPGARTTSGLLADNGEFLLYGGNGIHEDGEGWFSDLWSFNPANNEWTWIGGSDQLDQPAQYGTKGVPDPANRPVSTFMTFRESHPDAWMYSSAALWKLSRAEDGEDSVEVFESFNAKYKRHAVELRWKVSRDLHTDYIIVEHSKNGQTFSPLGRVYPPRYGRSRNYSYIHLLPGNGEHYYRLQHVDKKGVRAYSWTEKATIENSFQLPHHFNISFLLFPNPVRNWLYMSFNAPAPGNMEVMVYNNNGQPLIKQQQKINGGFNTLKINLNHYKPGVYTVVITINGKMYSKKMIKL